MDNTKPNLTEPGVKSFLNYALKQCHIIKINLKHFTHLKIFMSYIQYIFINL
jgi:hypothetical protein